MGINYENNSHKLNYFKYKSLIKSFLRRNNSKIIFEPGRSIIGNVGYLISKIIYIKNTLSKNFVILDSAMNDLIRPALYGAKHRIIPSKLNSKNITFANLKGTLEEFAQRIFGKTRKARFRCDFFPFVEPGAEMSIDCFKCEGSGCRVCGESGWIEILGAGMVHPEVLKGVGYDPNKYSGFAFGMGAERIATYLPEKYLSR